NAKLAGLLGSVGGADFAPTKGMRDVFEDLSRRVEAQVAKWTALADSDVVAFDRLVRSSGVPAVGMARSSKRMPRRLARRAAARPVRPCSRTEARDGGAIARSWLDIKGEGPKRCVRSTTFWSRFSR